VPSSALYPSARTVVNWRAFSLTAYIILLTSLMWEVTLALPYGWWGFQPDQMIGLTITAWDNLPIEEVVLWLTVTFTTVLVYEVVKRWQASGKPMRRAMLG
ncbi:MAG TPA: lycopene cyclase domain-containing protein, partial [Edaphobacter sp.]